MQLVEVKPLFPDPTASDLPSRRVNPRLLAQEKIVQKSSRPDPRHPEPLVFAPHCAPHRLHDSHPWAGRLRLRHLPWHCDSGQPRLADIPFDQHTVANDFALQGFIASLGLFLSFSSPFQVLTVFKRLSSNTNKPV